MKDFSTPFSSPFAIFAHIIRVITFQHDGSGLPRGVNFDTVTLAALTVATGLLRWNLVAHASDPAETFLSYGLSTLFCLAVFPRFCAITCLACTGSDLLASALTLAGLSTSRGIPYWLLLFWCLGAMFAGQRAIVRREFAERVEKERNR